MFEGSINGMMQNLGGGMWGKGMGRNRGTWAVCRGVWLCADSGQPAGLSDPALSLTFPGWSVPLLQSCDTSLCSSSLSVPCQICRGERAAAGQSVSGFEIRDQHQLSMQIPQTSGISSLQWAQSPLHIWSRAAHTAWDTAQCCSGGSGGSICITSKTAGRGCPYVLLAAKSMLDLLMNRRCQIWAWAPGRQRMSHLENPSEENDSCFLTVSCIYFH